MQSRRPRASLTKQFLCSSSLAAENYQNYLVDVFVLLGKNQSDQMREKCIASASYNN